MEIRRSHYRLVSAIEFAILVKVRLYTESGSWSRILKMFMKSPYMRCGSHFGQWAVGPVFIPHKIHVVIQIESIVLLGELIKWVSKHTSMTSLLPGDNPDGKVNGANMASIWGRQDPGGPHVGPMNFAIWEAIRRIRHIILVSFHIWVVK